MYRNNDDEMLASDKDVQLNFNQQRGQDKASLMTKPPTNMSGVYGNHYSLGSGVGSGVGNFDLDNKSVTSKTSKTSKFTYSGLLF